MKSLFPTLACLSILFALPAWAEDPESPPAPAVEEAQAQDAPGATEGEAAPESQPTEEDEKILEDLLRRRAKDKAIEPKRAPSEDEGVEEGVEAPKSSGPRGTAPDAVRREPTPREEGGFVIARRGRLIRVEGGPTPWAIAFAADSSNLDDPPLYLMPSTQLETMEAAAEKNADGADFIVSGEVFTYRGKSYLLPRLARPTTERGNLQP